MKAQIDNLFPNNTCVHSSSLSTIRIKEINQVAQIIQDENIQEHFKIINENKNRIGILIIDGCLKFKKNQKKCDFAFWNNNNFYFVEIKDTISRSSGNKKNAVTQLEKTIDYFKSNAINFGNRIIYAVVSWSYNPARPLATASMNTHKFRMKLKYNIELQEGNQILL